MRFYGIYYVSQTAPLTEYAFRYITKFYGSIKIVTI